MLVLIPEFYPIGIKTCHEEICGRIIAFVEGDTSESCDAASIPFISGTK